VVTTLATIGLFEFAGESRWGVRRRPWWLAIPSGLFAAVSIALWMNDARDLTLGSFLGLWWVALLWTLVTRVGVLGGLLNVRHAVARREGRVASLWLTSIVVDVLPSRLWKAGNLYGNSLHFCAGRHPSSGRLVRTVEWNGGRLVNGRRLFMEHEDPASTIDPGSG